MWLPIAHTLMAPLEEPRVRNLPSLENCIYVISKTEHTSAAGIPVPISYMRIVFRERSFSFAPKCGCAPEPAPSAKFIAF